MLYLHYGVARVLIHSDSGGAPRLPDLGRPAARDLPGNDVAPIKNGSSEIYEKVYPGEIRSASSSTLVSSLSTQTIIQVLSPN